jgi:hypothetical protein
LSLEQRYPYKVTSRGVHSYHHFRLERPYRIMAHNQLPAGRADGGRGAEALEVEVGRRWRSSKGQRWLEVEA